MKIRFPVQQPQENARVEQVAHLIVVEIDVIPRIGEGNGRKLARVAGEAGFSAQEAQSALMSVSLRAEVEAEDREARGVGINGVPFFIFNGRTAVAGAHDPGTLLEAIAAARIASQGHQ